jgi:hypothetical protein
MPTNILTTRSTVGENSSDVEIAAGSQLTVCLKGAGGVIDENSLVSILLKDDVGDYVHVDSLSKDKESKVLIGAGTYRFTRNRGMCGVFSG